MRKHRPLRVQLIHVISDAIGHEHISYHGNPIENVYQFIHDLLCREYGLFNLGIERSYEERVCNFILNEPDVEKVLDTIESCLKYLDKVIRGDNDYNYIVKVKMNVDSAIYELNERFKYHGVGYQYQSGEIIRVDSTYIHSEVVKATLVLIHNKLFQGVDEEYLKAHEHYRHGRNKECIAECSKALESTLKTIFTHKGWQFNVNDTTSTLVNVAFTNDLIPSYLQNQITSLKSLLTSGVPAIRNRLGGHGQGATQITADDETTRYALNMTGSTIVYLVELSKL